MFQCQYTCGKKNNKQTLHHRNRMQNFTPPISLFTFGYNSSIHKQNCTIVGKLDPWKSLMIERTISIMEHFKPSIINIICRSNSFFGMKEIYGKEWNKKDL